jgi:CheY-like chemotaxis protein
MSLILVVEDDVSNRRLLVLFLEKNGYTVDAVDTAEAALNAMRATVPDLVLLDIRLPGINGLEMIAQMRSDPRTAHIPVIGITASGIADDRELATAAGMNEFLRKPLNLSELHTLIRRYVA